MSDQLGSDIIKPSTTRRGSSKGSFNETKARLLGLDGLAGFGRGMSESLSMSALELEDDHEIEKEKKNDPPGANGLAHPHTISAQLFANPKLAALRTTGLPTTPSPALASAPPILADQRCSGYFVEAMRWMEPVLENGEMAGKITCPNKKCGVKLGNYDWTGVRCNCKAWVVPGLCIHRSKVDEIVV